MGRDEDQIPAGHFNCYEQHGSLSDCLLAHLVCFARRRHKAIWPSRHRSIPSAVSPEAERNPFTPQFSTRKTNLYKKEQVIFCLPPFKRSDNGFVPQTSTQVLFSPPEKLFIFLHLGRVP